MDKFKHLLLNLSPTNQAELQSSCCQH